MIEGNKKAQKMRKEKKDGTNESKARYIYFILRVL